MISEILNKSQKLDYPDVSRERKPRKQKSRFFVAKIAPIQKWRCIGDEVRTFFAAEGGR